MCQQTVDTFSNLMGLLRKKYFMMTNFFFAFFGDICYNSDIGGIFNDKNTIN